MSTIIDKYKYLFEHMSVKITNGQKKPNKAIMLISVIDLIRCGYIKDNKIYIENTIQEAFDYNWRKYVNPDPPTCWTPFWHLKNEPFWHFKPINSLDEINGLTKPGETASLSKMKSAIAYVYLDDTLFTLISNTESRTLLREVLIKTYIYQQDTSNTPTIEHFSKQELSDHLRKLTAEYFKYKFEFVGVTLEPGGRKKYTIKLLPENVEYICTLHEINTLLGKAKDRKPRKSISPEDSSKAKEQRFESYKKKFPLLWNRKDF